MSVSEAIPFHNRNEKKQENWLARNVIWALLFISSNDQDSAGIYLYWHFIFSLFSIGRPLFSYWMDYFYFNFLDSLNNTNLLPLPFNFIFQMYTLTHTCVWIYIYYWNGKVFKAWCKEEVKCLKWSPFSLGVLIAPTVSGEAAGQ